jgi:hypothetical protein
VLKVFSTLIRTKFQDLDFLLCFSCVKCFHNLVVRSAREIFPILYEYRILNALLLSKSQLNARMLFPYSKLSCRNNGNEPLFVRYGLRKSENNTGFSFDFNSALMGTFSVKLGLMKDCGSDRWVGILDQIRLGI